MVRKSGDDVKIVIDFGVVFLPSGGGREGGGVDCLCLGLCDWVLLDHA